MMKKVSEGFLYSLWNGTFKCYEGVIYESERMNDSLGRFGGTKIKKNFCCSVTPGEVYNAVVWLQKRDDYLGAKLLRDNLKAEMELLKEKMEAYKKKIKLLNEMERES